jgi:hypothetical protein
MCERWQPNELRWMRRVLEQCREIWETQNQHHLQSLRSRLRNGGGDSDLSHEAMAELQQLGEVLGLEIPLPDASSDDTDSESSEDPKPEPG